MLSELLKKFVFKNKKILNLEDLEASLQDFVPTLLKSNTLQEAFGLSAYELEILYSYGYEYYEKRDYNNAHILFRWLVVLDTFSSKFWIGLASTQQELGLYEKALHGWAICTLLDSTNPYPHFHAFECYTALSDCTNAKKALDLSWSLCLNSETYSDLKQTIESI